MRSNRLLLAMKVDVIPSEYQLISGPTIAWGGP